MTEKWETLDLRREGPLLWLTLDRPKALNAMNRVLVDDLLGLLDELRADPSVRVVVLRGAGRAFCAGLDLKQGGTADASVGGSLLGQHHIAELALRMHRAPQVFIAAVHGAATGGGFALALASDIRIAATSARMNAAFIRIGLTACDVGVSYFLPRIVGAGVASELLLTGEFIGAERALETGLVSSVVPDEDLEAAARAMAERVLRNSPLGVRLTKDCLGFSIDAPSLDSAIAMEDRNQILATRTADVREGIRAFLEKRDPHYDDT